jgi:hypothetical protein
LRAVSYAKERRSGTKLKELPAVEPATDEPSVEPEDWSLVEPGEPVAQIEPPVELAQELPDSPEEPETDW